MIQTDKPTNLSSAVVYRSRGRLLVMTQCRELAEILDAIPPNLKATILLTEPVSPELERRLYALNIGWLDHASSIRIEGYLGNFRVDVNRDGTREPEKLTADLILDLLEPPIVSFSVAPVGYFSKLRPGDERRETLAGLGEWVGEFEKPKFFDFNPSICAHQSSGIPGCTACIESCAAHAVSSDAGKIQVNPYLCQGCGDCAAVCPSGAIRYHYPPPETTLDELRRTLASKAANSACPRVVVFHDGEIEPDSRTGLDQMLSAEWLTFELESPGAAGIEIWLAALAYGASAVAILPRHDLNPETRRAIESQIRYANEILEGAALSGAVRLVAGWDELKTFADQLPARPAHAPASFAGLRDKRTVIRLALDFLTENQASRPQYVALSEGAPFGEIVVDPHRCTLCMACVSICPEQALKDGMDEPKLNFIEANCVQCGICKNACPEHAIELRPRYLFDSPEARKARLLHQDTPFGCVECGKPFATAKIIESITGKLSSHPMFQGDNLRRLLMCEECRVKSFFPGRRPQRPL
jgi:ferredoxin